MTLLEREKREIEFVRVNPMVIKHQQDQASYSNHLSKGGGKHDTRGSTPVCHNVLSCPPYATQTPKEHSVSSTLPTQNPSPTKLCWFFCYHFVCQPGSRNTSPLDE